MRELCIFSSKILIWKSILQFGSRNHRRNISKFRISNHKLEIEQGRYQNTSADKRTRKLCEDGVEDEIDFLLKCCVLDDIRKTTLSMIYKLHPNTCSLNDKDKFIWLMSTADPDMFHLLQQLLSSLSEERINILNFNFVLTLAKRWLM